jgi:hypothetical protein
LGRVKTDTITPYSRPLTYLDRDDIYPLVDATLKFEFDGAC